MAVELIIFDCDGVLIDSEVLACRIEAEELTRAGYQITVDEVATRFTGIPSAAMYEILGREQGRPVSAELAHRTRMRIHEAVATEVEAVPGVHEVLQDISHDVCVASTSSLEYLAIALGRVDLHDRFAPNIFSGQQVERGKPAPDLFLFAAAEMGTAPEHCLVIEDSIAGVTGGGHSVDGHGRRLADAGAEQVFDDMTHLPSLLRDFG
ncbi:MAG: HAD-IA family hydrolase [Alphaproteobacteria bacterium]|jgi:HAD superfamily hydrolase (TIGR01509 family)|nr:HAD-IA family hydrolase [Alphaproteobacteria bacterium]